MGCLNVRSPDVRRLALRPEAEDESGTQTSFVVGLNNEHLVEVAGIEPASLSNPVETATCLVYLLNFSPAVRINTTGRTVAP